MTTEEKITAIRQAHALSYGVAKRILKENPDKSLEEIIKSIKKTRIVLK